MRFAWVFLFSGRLMRINSPGKVLLTAFEPYGLVKVNSSWEAIRDWEGRKIGGAVLSVACLPVVYGAVRPRLAGLLRRGKPELVIAFGQYPQRRREIFLEHVALNVDFSEVPDNRGACAAGTCVRTDRPLALASGLPLDRIYQRLKALGVPVKHSYFAGTYLCNHLFYHLCDLATAGNKKIRAGFIHLPPLSRSMPLVKLRRAVSAVVRAALAT